ncbi:hypothetical protein Misp01_56190 [Microtetraspora sp. NBRC 13810]|nr:hypothetical protein Misp01_56190 [Microtetraspora sp. NBRC 13810]
MRARFVGKTGKNPGQLPPLPRHQPRRVPMPKTPLRPIQQPRRLPKSK